MPIGDCSRDYPRIEPGVDLPGGERHQHHLGRPGEPVERARFVPCPPSEVERPMKEHTEFIEADNALTMPPLVVAARVHDQFETIHPFPDGKGRPGRSLIPLLFVSRGRLNAPLLYPSPQIEARRTE
ncbi:MAG: Fic family protein [Geminicoccaceae bacterium]|nr:Fic family protein [Geminicoccaceae bacterium]MDW8369979.1 Fic family protein [Geminicoccaceae bacterium]